MRISKTVNRVALLALVVVGSVAARQQPSLISGVVTDASGASLRKARILLVDLSSFETQKAEVGLDGTFEFQVKPGDYALTAGTPKDAPCWKPPIRQVAVEFDGVGSGG